MLFFRLNIQTDSSRKNNAFLQYMKGRPVLKEEAKELVCVRLRPSTTSDEDHSTVSQEELNIRTELVVCEYCGVQQISVLQDGLDVQAGNYAIRPLSRALPRPYHLFYINRVYTKYLLNEESIQSKVWKDKMTGQNKGLSR